MRPLRWFVQALRRFTNFRTIELYLPDGFLEAYRMIEFFQTTLEPMFGRAEAIENVAIESFGYR